MVERLAAELEHWLAVTVLAGGAFAAAAGRCRVAVTLCSIVVLIPPAGNLAICSQDVR